MRSGSRICTVQTNARDSILKVRDGDAVLVREGYHPVVAGPGYDLYYLNFLAGTSRAMMVTEDPDHVWLRSSWRQPDTLATPGAQLRAGNSGGGAHDASIRFTYDGLNVFGFYVQQRFACEQTPEKCEALGASGFRVAPPAYQFQASLPEAHCFVRPGYKQPWFAPSSALFTCRGFGNKGLTVDQSSFRSGSAFLQRNQLEACQWPLLAILSSRNNRSRLRFYRLRRGWLDGPLSHQ